MTGFVGRMTVGILMVLVLGAVVTMSGLPVIVRLVIVLMFGGVIVWQHRQFETGHRLADRREHSNDQIQPRK